MSRIRDVFKPQAVVCQCGADCLAGDPMGIYNLTPQGMAHCVDTIHAWDLPLLLLGGGKNVWQVFDYSYIMGVYLSYHDI